MKLRLVKQGEFLGIKCDFWMDEHGEVYMTREQIGRALQYRDPASSIEVIHRRNADRLDRLSSTVKLTGVDGREREHIVYKVKGIFDVIRYSRQPIADDFMDWVYDILDAIRVGRISQQVLRDAGITIRRTMTDSIRDYVEESPNKKFQYRNYTELVYKHLFGMSAKDLRLELGLKKDEKIRDHLTAEELEAVLTAERQISTLLEMNLSYHDIKAILSKKQVSRALPRTGRDRDAAEQAN
ncbi:BRO family protein [Paenibacillus bouchesdurhonensis]|uniref:BRO family protein n=1 Tax=Paenibacillus bouchesdurhonensis TaxID=1870990 RepID=UPI000DA61048|nr:BRO family protein [Paenibacillus bouchesdurhonensis]